jgi:Tol biopolymer transport system component
VGGWFLFVSDRVTSDSCGGNDIYITRYDPSLPNPWGEVRNLGCYPDGPNTPGSELSPSLVTTSKGIFLYYSSNYDREKDDVSNQDIYRSRLELDGSYPPGEPVTELNTAEFNDQQPNVRKDGLEIVFSSDRDGVQDVFSASRESLDDDWSNLRNLSVELEFPTEAANETRPSLSWDGKRLYYGSGGTIYVGERKPGRGPRN